MATFKTLAVGAGGGSGGGSANTSKSGGGGGGQVLDSASTALAIGTYAITVGAHGTAGASGDTAGNPGGSSSIGSAVTALGGGGSGAGGTTSANPTSGSGNGGGGGGFNNGSSTAGTGVQHNGGAGYAEAGNASASGGGGGAGGNGSAGAHNAGGNAGIGLASTISGASLTYGCGGIGNGVTTNGTSASGTDYGRGADGQGPTGANPFAGANGFDGIVVISFATGAAITVTSSTNAVFTQSGGFDIYTWTVSGSFSFVAPLLPNPTDSSAVSDTPTLVVIDESIGLVTDSTAVSDTPTLQVVTNDAVTVSFRNATSPYDVLTSPSFVKTAPNGDVLPVKEGETSDTLHFRVYNNFGLSANIGTMTNVKVTVFSDPRAQAWIKICQTGYGQGAVAPGAYSQVVDEPTAIGNSGISTYSPVLGSDGTTSPHILAGTDTNGCGFIEFAVYIEVPSGEAFANFPFSIAVEYI